MNELPLNSFADLMSIRRRQAEIFQALGHPIRLDIIEFLSETEAPVGAIQHQLEYPQAIISQQLAVLRRAGLVATRIEGRAVFYRLASERPVEAARLIEPLAISVL